MIFVVLLFPNMNNIFFSSSVGSIQIFSKKMEEVPDWLYLLFLKISMTADKQTGSHHHT